MSAMTIERIETAPFIEGDRLCVLRKTETGYDYVPATVVATERLEHAPFGRNWLLHIRLDNDVESRVSVDYNGVGYDVPGRPSTQPYVED
jgi:hypothetical protein